MKSISMPVLSSIRSVTQTPEDIGLTGENTAFTCSPLDPNMEFQMKLTLILQICSI